MKTLFTLLACLALYVGVSAQSNVRSNGPLHAIEAVNTLTPDSYNKTAADTTFNIAYWSAEAEGRGGLLNGMIINTDTFGFPFVDNFNRRTALLCGPHFNLNTGIVGSSHLIASDSTLYSLTGPYKINSVAITANHKNVSGQIDSIILSVVPVSFIPNPFGNNPITIPAPSTDRSQAYATEIIQRDFGNVQDAFAFPPQVIQQAFTDACVPASDASNGFGFLIEYSGPTVDTFVVWGGTHVKFNPATGEPYDSDDFTDPFQYQDSIEQADNHTSFLEFEDGQQMMNYLPNRSLVSINQQTQEQSPYNGQHIWMEINVTTESSDCITTSAEEDQVAPDELAESVELGNPFPNPASAGQEIKLPFRTSVTQDITLKVFNTVGQEVRNYVHTDVKAGAHEFRVPTGDLTPGIYFMQFESEAVSNTFRVVVGQ